MSLNACAEQAQSASLSAKLLASAEIAASRPASTRTCGTVRADEISIAPAEPGAPLPATSFLGGFRTPALSRTWLRPSRAGIRNPSHPGESGQGVPPTARRPGPTVGARSFRGRQQCLQLRPSPPWSRRAICRLVRRNKSCAAQTRSITEVDIERGTVGDAVSPSSQLWASDAYR